MSDILYLWPLLIYPVGPSALALLVNFKAFGLEDRLFERRMTKTLYVIIAIAVVFTAASGAYAQLQPGCATQPVGWHGCGTAEAVSWVSKYGAASILLFAVGAWICRFLWLRRQQ